MASLIGALRVTLGLDTAEFSAGMAKAEGLTKRSLAGIKGAIGGFAAGVGAAALVALAQRSLDYASSLGEVAQQLGITTTELQEYRYAASQVGIEQDTMDKALQKLTRTIGQAATGGKAQAAVFDALGVSVRDANGHVRTAGEVLPDVADALAKIPDPARRAAVETQLFGRAGQQLDTLLAGGSAAINELRDAAHRLGIVLGEQEIQRADETADKLAAVKQVLEAKIAGTVAGNAQAIVGLASALAQLTGAIVQFMGSNPEAALALLGAGVGARAGPWGALTGAAAGALAGAQIRKSGDDANSDIEFRRQRHAEALAQFNRLKGMGRGIGAPGTGPYRTAEAKLRHETALLRQATAQYRAGQSKPAPAPGPDIDLGGGGAKPGGRKAGGGGGASGPSAAEIEDRLHDQIVGYAQQALSGMQAMAKSADERAELELRAVEMSRLRMLAEVEGEKHYSAAQKERLTNQIEVLAAIERERVAFDRQAAVERDIADLAETRYRADADALQVQFDTARSQDERRRIAVELVELEHRHRRALLEAILASETAADAEKERARVLLQGLGAGRAGAMERARRDTAGPMESYFDSLPKSAAEANEAMEQVAAGGLQSVIDGLAEAGVGARNLGDVFRDVARQIIADLIRIQMRRAIMGALGAALGIGAAPALGQAAPGTLEANFDAAFAHRIPGMARGGMFAVGGRPGIDTNLLSINGQPRARVSASETVAIIPNNRGGGRGTAVSFDLRGAVMTADLVAQMQRIAASTGGVAAIAGGQLGEQRVMARGRRRIPG